MQASLVVGYHNAQLCTVGRLIRTLISMRIILFLVFLSITSNSWATAFTLGTVEEWREWTGLANKHIKTDDDSGESKLEKSELERAVFVIGFFEGLRQGHFIDELIGLRKKNKDDMSDDEIKNMGGNICIDDPYFKIIDNLNIYLENGELKKEDDFGPVLVNFLEEKYICK